MKSFLKKLVPISIKHAMKIYLTKQVARIVCVPKDMIITDRMAYDNNKYPYVYKEDEENIYNVSAFKDYVRYRAFELCANEIENHQVTGSIAEVGVYKGSFARHLNARFPKRIIYLFDTFKGFDDRDKKIEIENAYTSNSFFTLTNDFKESSAEEVYNSMPCKDKVIIKEGYFPETAIGLENERYAFVSIDVDLYLPIFEGIKYFYPKLEKGGYIFIHDYNHVEFLGVKKAVSDFEAIVGYKLMKFPLPDQGGTLVITK